MIYSIKAYINSNWVTLYYPGSDAVAYSITLTEKLNDAGELKATIPPTNEYYSSLVEGSTKVRVDRDDTPYWYGYLTDTSKNLRTEKVCTFIGELSYLNGSIQPQASYHDQTPTQLLTAYLAAHNSQSSETFTVGTVTVTDPNDSVYRYTNYETTLTEIRDDLCESLEGYLRIRHVNGVRYLDLVKLSDYGANCEQTIEFGSNLLDFTQDITASDIATAVIPLGEKLDEAVVEGLDAYLTIKSVNSNLDYLIDNTAVATYGLHKKVVHWDNVTDATTLKTKGQAWLNESQYANLTLTLKAVDLSVLDADIDTFELGDTVRVHACGLNTSFPLREKTTNFQDPTQSTITLGNSVNVSYTQQQATVSSDIEKEIPKQTTILDLAKVNAWNMIESASEGNIYTEYDSNHKPIALYIMNNADESQATKRWKWNINGLSYCYRASISDAWTVASAMTMDGGIVADFLTTGVIRGGTNNYWNLDTGDFNMTSVNTAIQNLQDQIDNAIETWFYSGVPTLSNLPASQWTTTAVRNQHLGDLYYDTATGYAYRFACTSSVYSWLKITDSDVTEALALARTAQDTADNKRRVFVATPTPPYDVGDLWTNGTDIKRCQTAKTSTQSYSASDWVLADNAKSYADSVVNAVQVGGTNLVVGSATATVGSQWAWSGWQTNTLTQYDTATRTYKFSGAHGWCVARYTGLTDYVGKAITISFDAKCLSTETTATDYRLGTVNLAGSNPYFDNVFSLPTQDEWVHYSYSYEALNSDAQIGIGAMCAPEGNQLASTYLIKNLKLEIGNKATDWSPAPEDVSADATTKASSAETSAKSYADAQDVTTLSTANSNAQGYADTAQTNAISTASADATTKANNALSSAKSYTDSEISDYDEDLNQTAVFNKLTNNGTAQGMIMSGGQLYVNASYINSGTMSANRIKGDTLTLGGSNNTNGTMAIKDASSNTIGTWNNTGLTTLYSVTYNYTDYSSSDLTRIRGITGGTITPTSSDYEKYDLDKDGNIKLLDYGIVNTMITNSVNATLTWNVYITPSSPTEMLKLTKTLTYGSTTTTTNLLTVGTKGIAECDYNDFIIEEGNSGDIYYRKWKSGNVDVWGYASVTTSSYTASGNVYYSNDASITLPFTCSLKGVSITISNAGRYATRYGGATSASTLGLRVCGGSSSAVVGTFTVWFTASGTLG